MDWKIKKLRAGKNVNSSSIFKLNKTIPRLLWFIISLQKTGGVIICLWAVWLLICLAQRPNYKRPENATVSL